MAHRIGRLARLPIYLDLRGSACLVVGGGPIGQWKAEVLAASGAQVLVVDPKARPCGGATSGVTVAARPFSDLDTAGKKVVIAATADAETNRLVAEAGRRNGALVNVVDAGDVSDFIFPAIVNRSPVIVAISTEGSAPVLARMLRRKIELLLPADLEAIVGFACEKRRELARIFAEPAKRRRLWEDFFERVLTEGIGGQERLEQEFRALIDAARAPTGGVDLHVALVEMPAHEDELTARALRWLNNADMIVSDDKAPQTIADRARREARRISVGGTPTMQQSIWMEAIEEARRAAAVGSRVVWLCSRDRDGIDKDWLKARFAEKNIGFVYLPSALPPRAAPTSPSLR